MIGNCEGCQIELEEIKMYSNPPFNLNFAGKGLYEKGHLIMVMVNDGGKVEVG
jgi:hypothetical protein